MVKLLNSFTLQNRTATSRLRIVLGVCSFQYCALKLFQRPLFGLTENCWRDCFNSLTVCVMKLQYPWTLLTTISIKCLLYIILQWPQFPVTNWVNGSEQLLSAIVSWTWVRTGWCGWVWLPHAHTLKQNHKLFPRSVGTKVFLIQENKKLERKLTLQYLSNGCQ